jgi:hypothetical protein
VKLKLPFFLGEGGLMSKSGKNREIKEEEKQGLMIIELHRERENIK